MHSTTKVRYLDSPQIDKLRRVLNPIIPIYPSPSSSTFPTLHIVPKDFLRQVFLKLKEHSIDVSSIRLNGGAASYVLIKDSNFAYRDIDILFIVNTPLTAERETTLYSSNNEPYLCDVWTMIKYIICSCLIEQMHDVQACTPTFIASILDTYTKKNIQICSEHDSWALLSLQNLLGRNLELKFIERWKRQWQFSVDSFQIDLRELLFETSTHPRTPPTTTTIPLSSTGNVKNTSINDTNVRKQDEQKASNSTPLEFVFLTSSPLSTSQFFPTNENRKQSQSSNPNAIVEKSESRTISTENIDDDDDDDNVTVQLHLSTNEDIDDGIVVDTDESTVDDDESNYRTPPMEMASTFSVLPLISFHCAYKDLDEALTHLNNKLIATYEPEKLRGGGLLKYCDLLAQSYKAVNANEMNVMQRYMCSRFFIDFKTLPEQILVISKYVSTHFLPSSIIHDLCEQNRLNEFYFVVQNQHATSTTTTTKTKEIDEFELKNARLCLLFFQNLSGVIQQSCVCLTGHDKFTFDNRLNWLKECYHQEYEHLFVDDAEHQRLYHTFPSNYFVQHPMQWSSRNYSRHSSGRHRGHSYSSKSFVVPNSRRFQQ